MKNMILYSTPQVKACLSLINYHVKTYILAGYCLDVNRRHRMFVIQHLLILIVVNPGYSFVGFLFLSIYQSLCCYVLQEK